MRLLFFLSACLAALQLPAQTCNYLAYDAFNYPVNSPLEGQQGGSGWAAPWTVQGSNATVPGFNALANNLTYSDLQTAGNHLTGGYQYLSAGRLLNTSNSGAFAPWLHPDGGIGLSGTTLWASVLLQKNDNNAETVSVGWHRHDIPWCWGCSSDRLEVGYFGAASDVSGQRRWSLYLNGTVYPTAVPLVVGQAAFLVVKMEFGATNTISVYVNPTSLGNDVPASPTLTQTTGTAFRIRSVSFHVENNPGGGEMDELRMGASYACVAPDADVTVNQPPTAAFSSNPASGTAPLNVTFNGTASSDPEGGALTYTWNFGDGSASVTGGSSSVNHTFTATGILNVSLTVADPEGVQHTVFQTITVYNASGAFTCQLGLVNEQLASCTGNDGRFRVTNYNNIPLTLRNASNTVVPPAVGNANLYDQLAPGIYQLTAAGGNGCRDTFTVHIQRDSHTCPGWTPNPCAMNIGAGIEGMAYYSVGRPFKDYFKSSGTWITYDPTPPPGDPFTWNTGDQNLIPADTDGYSTVVPFSAPGGSGTRALRGIISAIGFIPQGVPMRLLYDGVGTLQMQGAVTVTSNQPGQIDFTVNDNGNIFFNLTASQSGNHVRNIRVIEVADAGTYLTQPFRQSFLNNCLHFNTLRMMDWTRTNGNTNVQWANRTTPTYYSQAESPNGGLAYEYVIQLANTLHKDIWVCVPHQADDAYVTQMATLFRDQLDPGINVYLEYSNEVWNWIFSQAHWVADNGPQNISYPRRYVERAQNAFQIWHDVWGTQKHRVRRVLGTQNGYDWVTEEILAHADQDQYDYISPSWYVGLDHSNSGVPNLVALGASATAEDVLANANHAFETFYPHWQMVYRTAKLYGKKVVNYEGGQHFTDFSIPPYIQAMYDAQVHPGMYDLYQRMLDSLRILGSEMPLAFVLTGPWQSQYGSWGHLFSEDDPAPWNDRPKFQVLLDNIALCTTTLAVELTDFQAVCQSDGIVSRWATAAESDHEVFVLESSDDGITWRTRGQVAAQSPTGHRYQTLLPAGSGAYFRLKMLDRQGNVTYTPVVKTNCPADGDVRVFPNPSTGEVTLELPESWTDLSGQVRVLNAAGVVEHLYPLNGNRKLPLTNLPPGFYTLQIANADGQVVAVKRLIRLAE